MHSYLRIFRTGTLDLEELYRFMDEMNDYGRLHFLVSDGIILDLPEIFPGDSGVNVRMQRILTSYQLQRILLESDNNPHFIALVSAVISEWATESVDSIYQVMKIKSYYRHCPIAMNIVGKEGVYENYLGKRVIGPGKGVKLKGGLYEWEERRQQ